mgnify:CR=1 FL=1
MQNTLEQRQLGLGMFGQGMQGNINAQGLYGQVGGNLLNSAQNFAGGAFNAGMAGNQLQSQRALQRLQNAQNLFGFGQAAQSQDFNTALGFLSANQNMQNALQQWTALGINAGGNQAQAGANAGRFGMAGARNNLGDFIGGVGAGMMDGSFKLPDFGGGGSPDYSEPDIYGWDPGHD